MARSSQYAKLPEERCDIKWPRTSTRRGHFGERSSPIAYGRQPPIPAFEEPPIEYQSPSELEEWYGKAHPTHSLSNPQSSPEIMEESKSLCKVWRSETAGLSVLAKRVMHPAYQQIIGMGPIAIPLILREMQRVPGHWFWALEALTRGKFSVGKDAQTLTDLAKAWIDWGKREGLI